MQLSSCSILLGFMKEAILYGNYEHCVKMSKYGVISGPYFSVFGLNTGKYRPEITPYLDTFHAVEIIFYQGRI